MKSFWLVTAIMLCASCASTAPKGALSALEARVSALEAKVALLEATPRDWGPKVDESDVTPRGGD